MTDKHQTTIRIDRGLYERLRKIAFNRRVSQQSIMDKALKEHLDKLEEKPFDD